uniref:Uncharacterized protein n=1 Tax=Sphaerodactylus townsendi TaxID=933632 RepID=A0ACB8F0B7_9SAUR
MEFLGAGKKIIWKRCVDAPGPNHPPTRTETWGVSGTAEEPTSPKERMPLPSYSCPAGDDFFNFNFIYFIFFPPPPPQGIRDTTRRTKTTISPSGGAGEERDVVVHRTPGMMEGAEVIFDAPSKSGRRSKPLLPPPFHCASVFLSRILSSLQTSPRGLQLGKGTDALLLTGFLDAEAPLRLPSVRTTCSGLRDCTVVCTLVRLCWDIPHPLLAGSGRDGNACMARGNTACQPDSPHPERRIFPLLPF